VKLRIVMMWAAKQVPIQCVDQGCGVVESCQEHLRPFRGAPSSCWYQPARRTAATQPGR